MHLKVFLHLSGCRGVQFSGAVVAFDARREDEFHAIGWRGAGFGAEVRGRVGCCVESVGAHEGVEVAGWVGGAEGGDGCGKPGWGWWLLDVLVSDFRQCLREECVTYRCLVGFRPVVCGDAAERVVLYAC